MKDANADRKIVADNGEVSSEGVQPDEKKLLGARKATIKAVIKRQPPGYDWKRIWYFFFRQTSPIHRQDAKEKYWILWRELETAMYAKAIDLGFAKYSGFKEKTSEEVEKTIADFMLFLSKQPNEDPAKAKSFGNLLLYARILSKQPLQTLNRADNLNMMWRDITFIRSRLLTDPGVIADERLPAQLEYCRLEWCNLTLGLKLFYT